jgi:hypothetical protein
LSHLRLPAHPTATLTNPNGAADTSGGNTDGCGANIDGKLDDSGDNTAGNLLSAQSTAGRVCRFH